MCDCYALNVAADTDVWCYYYTEFPLVRIRGRQIDGVWKTRLAGSHAFAVSDGHALFSGEYNEQDVYHLLELGADGGVEKLAKIRLADERGNRLAGEHVVGRGDTLHVLDGLRLYKIDVATAINAVKG
jgi:hypothetical protein